MFSVDSESMSPNLNIGDIAIIEGTFRTEIITREEATKKEYKSFNLPGDVILYQPYGKELNKSSPIMHRVIRWVEEGKSMWEGGPAAPFSGYITMGDHDEVIDQMAGQIYGEANLSYIQSHRNAIKDVGNDVYIDNETGLIIYKTLNGTFIGDGISFLTPVKKDWILGVVRARIANGSDWTKLGTYNEN